MTTHAPTSDPAHAGEDLSADEFGDHQHGATDRQYIVVALILAVITAAEVSVSYLDIGPVFLPALLIMMAAKFITVVSYFMHLKFDAPILRKVFYAGLITALAVYLVALSTFHFWGRPS